MLNTSDCGRPGPSQIIGGQVSREGAWPWHVGVFFSSGSQSTYQCGGSLINSRYIITAAHCTFQKLSNSINIRYVHVSDNFYFLRRLLACFQKNITKTLSAKYVLSLAMYRYPSAPESTFVVSSLPKAVT